MAVQIRREVKKPYLITNDLYGQFHAERSNMRMLSKTPTLRLKMNPFSSRDDLPLGTTLAEVSRRERNRREDEEFWSQWWDDQHRWEEENRRDEL